VSVYNFAHMNRLTQIRESNPGIYAQAATALVAQGEVADACTEAKKAYGVSAATASQLGRKLLSVVCEDKAIPLFERAGWSVNRFSSQPQHV
jgi:hypothetical protein